MSRRVVGPADCETAALDMPVGLTLAQVEAIAQLRHGIPPARIAQPAPSNTPDMCAAPIAGSLTECISANVELARE